MNEGGMMKRYQVLAIVFLVLPLFAYARQDSDQGQTVSPVVVHAAMGDTLDLSERDAYSLFPNVEGFRWAVFTMRDDSVLVAHVSHMSREGVQKVVRVFPYRTFGSLSAHIEEYLARRREESFRAARESPAILEIELSDGSIARGKLVSTSDDVIQIVLRDQEDQHGLLQRLRRIHMTEIKKVTVEGLSAVGAGIGIGLLAGAALGVIAAPPEPSRSSSSGGGSGLAPSFDLPSSDLIYGAGGAILGGLAGLVVGLALSTPDREIDPLTHEDLHQLRLKYLPWELESWSPAEID